MIKVEHVLLTPTLEAIAFEASTEAELATLDRLYDLFYVTPNVMAGFSKTNRLVIRMNVVPVA